ncbi:MAG: hypothetical protein IJ636_03700 [Bacteroidales bacterium]|nr:hypothetical protein [Bacteroidales bacterium]
MKRVFVLIAIALMSIVSVNAKTVRGYVSDKEGKPVAGLTLVAYYVDDPSRSIKTVTGNDGYFEMQVPDDLDVAQIRQILSNRYTYLIDYRYSRKGLLITVDQKKTR